MRYNVKLKNTKLNTDSTKIARNVVNIIHKDNSQRRKHGFNITGADRHKIFYLKDKLHRELKKNTNVNLSEYFDHLNDDLFNQINHWTKEEILYIVENVNARLKHLVNSPVLFRHTMNSIRAKRCAIRSKKKSVIPRKILVWLDEFGYM